MNIRRRTTTDKPVSNVYDLINEAGRALRALDLDLLQRLFEINEQWVQEDDERNDIQEMLEAMMEAVEDLS